MKPFDLLPGEWWKGTLQTGSKISDVYVTPDQGPAQTAVTYAWGGGCFDSLRKDLIITGGGHSAYRGNEGYAFSVDPNDADFLKWRVKWKDSTATEGASVEAYSDGTPSSCHGYCCWQYHAGRDKIYRLPGCFCYGSAPNSTVRVYELDASVESPSSPIPSYWTRKSDMPVDTSSGTSVVDPNTGYIFQHRDGGTGSLGPMKYDPGTDTWTELLPGGFGNGVSNYSTGCAADKSSHFMMVGGSGAWYHLMPSASDIVIMANTGATALEGVTGPGFVFSEIDNKFYGWYGLLSGGTDKRDYYKFDFATKVWTRMAGTGDVPPTPEPNGIWGRFMSLDAAGGNYRGLVALVNSTTEEVYFLRVAAPPSAALTGTATAGITEADVVAGGKTIIATITNDTLVPASAGAISYVGGQGAGFAGTTAAQTITFALTGGSDATPQAGDLVIIAYSVGSTADRALAIRNAGATDYTLAGSELYQNDTFDANLRVAYRFMPGTPETQFVLTETVGGGTGNIADAGRYTVHVFRGVDPTTPLDVAAVTAGNINTRIVNPSAITPTTAGAVIYVAGGGAGGTGGTYTAGYLSDFRAGSTADTNDAMIGAGYVPWTSGAYDPAAFGGGGTDTVNDAWAAVTLALRPYIYSPFDLARADIANGIDSAQAEGSGWDAKVKPNIPVGNIVRTSNTVVTVTLQAQADYDISATETITVTVPASAVSGGNAIIATPTFAITAAAGGGGGVFPPFPRNPNQSPTLRM